ncbi:T9SS type A sorting domain-containing protein [Spongiimicrobium salis]|uniref:T9SS type A sorting domain-containing protein n=1 Tax=Spongiimicrobium salis TaxID=1667022 RepID=UPI00374D0F2D
MGLKTTLLLLFTAAFFYQAKAQCNADFEEQNGIVVIEMESGNLASGWERETGRSGFTGDSFIAWRGQDNFNTPGRGVIEYSVRINTPGVYRMQWRSRIGIGSNSTEHNDSWFRVPDAFDLFGRRGNDFVYPRGGNFRRSNEVAEGASGNGWLKAYLSGSTNWTWSTLTNDGIGYEIFVEFSSPGTYTVQVSGRSNGHFIDRMVLYREGVVSESSATSLSREETRCSGEDPEPDPDPAPAIASLQLINADTNTAIGTLTNNTTINLADINNATLSVNALTQPSTVGSVRMALSGPINSDRTENVRPYALFGDSGSNFTGRAFPEGDYSLRVTPYSGSAQSGTAGNTTTINFSVVDDATVDCSQLSVTLGSFSDVEEDTASFALTGGSPAGGTYSGTGVSNGNFNPGIGPGTYTITYSFTDATTGCSDSATNTIRVTATTPQSAITSFVLVNADTDQDIGVIAPGMQYNINDLPTTNLDIRANTGTTVGSVALTLTGNPSVSRTENVAPYALFGNIGTNYIGAAFNLGNYQISATPFSGSNRSGTAGTPLSIDFSIVAGSGEEGEDPLEFTFRAMDSSTDRAIRFVINGTTVRRNNNINFRVSTNDDAAVGSIGIQLTGVQDFDAIENGAPYALFGNVGNDYLDGSLPNGTYTLRAEAFSGSNLTGSSLGSRTVTFRILGTASSTQQLVAFPNPVVGSTVSVQIPENMGQEMFYSVVNAAGLELETGKVSVIEGQENAVFNLKSFNTRNTGIYYLVIQSGGIKRTVPLVKQ